MHVATQTPTDPDVDERQGHVPPVRNPSPPDPPPQPAAPAKR
jgi:hypothetical protein